MAGSKNQSLGGSSSSSITRLSKRLAPPPSMLRWSKLNVICASVLGTNSFFRFVPGRNLFADAETEQQRLIGQGNRRAPFHSENAELGNCGDAAGLHIWRNPALPREIHEFFLFVVRSMSDVLWRHE